MRAVSFGRGPNAKMIGRFRDAGILCIPTVGAVKHARKMVELGVDMLTVQGGEGGGHTGSVPTTVLLPQVLDASERAGHCSGGFADGRGLVAALAYGAVGIGHGHAFPADPRKPGARYGQSCLPQGGTDQIIVTTRLDGIPQRMVRTPLMDRIERSGSLGMWWRAFEAGREMKRQTGASWLHFIKAARGMDWPR